MLEQPITPILKSGEETILKQTYTSTNNTNNNDEIELIQALNYLLTQHVDQIEKLNMLIRGNALLFAILVKVCEFNKIDLSQLQKEIAQDIIKNKEHNKEKVVNNIPMMPKNKGVI